MVKSTIASAMVLLATTAPRAGAQSAVVEVAQTAGWSSDDVAAGATQLRAFGDAPGAMRYFAETAWGARSQSGTDVFGAAYPYGNRVQVIEAFGERTFAAGAGFVSLRGGRYRTPFGISSGSDHGYVGFLRPPLIRYDNYFALSNNFLEHGADVVAGVPALSVEGSVGTPADVGAARRRPGADAIVRVQGAFRSLIVGVSHIRTQPYQPEIYAHGRSVFTGVDARWMAGGIQVRGEWIDGRPFDTTTTSGGYVDAMVHRPEMGPVTALLRAERVDYKAGGPFDVAAARYTGGARVRLLRYVAVSVGVAHQPNHLSQRRATALDFGVTCTLRRQLVGR